MGMIIIRRFWVTIVVFVFLTLGSAKCHVVFFYYANFL